MPYAHSKRHLREAPRSHVLGLFWLVVVVVSSVCLVMCAFCRDCCSREGAWEADFTKTPQQLFCTHSLTCFTRNTLFWLSLETWFILIRCLRQITQTFAPTSNMDESSALQISQLIRFTDPVLEMPESAPLTIPRLGRRLSI